MLGSRIKTTLLLAVLTGVVIWIGGVFGGRGGMFAAFLPAAVMNAGSYWFSDRIVLAMYHEAASTRLPLDANPETAHMFIVNPLSGRALAGLFSTHPPIEERIRRLRAMR